VKQVHNQLPGPGDAMTQGQHNIARRGLKTVGGLALLAMPYAAYVATTWYRYGRPQAPRGGHSGNSLIERFMPAAEVAEHHEIQVSAPVEDTYAAARGMDLNRSAVVRAIFAVRAIPSRLRGEPSARSSQPLLDETLALGWRILGERPDREVVVGAVTQPWRADVTFRGLDPDTFVGFEQPGYAKIVWTIEAEPLGPATSRFRTQTRVATTDPRSRELFRRYWAVLSPGILLIRRQSLKLVKAEAERRFHARVLEAASRSGVTRS
jgi:hypothetical protein